MRGKDHQLILILMGWSSKLVLKYTENLGSTNKFPRWAIAAKFSSEEALHRLIK